MTKHIDPMTKKPIRAGEHMPGVPGKAAAAPNSTSGNPGAERKAPVARGKKSKKPARVARY